MVAEEFQETLQHTLQIKQVQMCILCFGLGVLDSTYFSSTSQPVPKIACLPGPASPWSVHPLFCKVLPRFGPLLM